MSVALYTIGYEGSEIHSFIATLLAVGIQHVIDIRDVPVSRKRGFSKGVLATALKDAGIEYTHLKALGDPKPGRDAMRQGDYSAFLRVYEAHLKTSEAQEGMRAAVEIAASSSSVLLCYERASAQCHRSIVATKMKERQTFAISHIGVNADVRAQERWARSRQAVLETA